MTVLRSKGHGIGTTGTSQLIEYDHATDDVRLVSELADSTAPCLQPEWRRQLLIVHTPLTSRSPAVTAHCSRSAKAGVRIGMPLAEAQALVPRGVFVTMIARRTATSCGNWPGVVSVSPRVRGWKRRTAPRRSGWMLRAAIICSVIWFRYAKR